MQEPINFKGLIQTFINNGAVAWIPCDNIFINEYQSNTNRYHWHKAADELGVTHKTLNLWSHVLICETHGKTLNYRNCDCGNCGPYRFKCDDEDEDSYCSPKNKPVLSKVRTVVLFRSDIIKNMTDQQIKDYLVKEKVIEIRDRKYYII